MTGALPTADGGGAAEAGGAPARRDPWRGLRGVMAATLLLQAIVMLLALPVLATGEGLGWWRGGYVVVLAILLLLASGMQRRPGALALNLGLTAGMIAGFFVHPAIGVLGLLFAAVWAYILYLRADLRRRLTDLA